MSELKSNLNRNKIPNLYKDTEFLSSNVKGYLYEYEIWFRLDNYINIDIVANPRNYQEWLENTIVGHDIEVELPNKEWKKVEVKFTATHIYPCWFERDWLTRDADIFVTNNKWNIPQECREELKRRGIKLFNDYEFIEWILKQYKTSNQYNWNIITYSIFYNYLTEILRNPKKYLKQFYIFLRNSSRFIDLVENSMKNKLKEVKLWNFNTIRRNIS